jgi:hypothetical protein
LTLDIAGFAQSLMERGAYGAFGDATPRKPITGIALCCARRVRAAIIAPASNSNNSRRFIR